jgi:hypothetical protein
MILKTGRQVDVAVSYDINFCKFYSRYNDLIYNHKLSLNIMLSDIFHTSS